MLHFFFLIYAWVVNLLLFWKVWCMYYPSMDCTKERVTWNTVTLSKTGWMEFLFFKKNPKLYFPLSFISGSGVTNLLGRVSSSLKSAFAEVDSQHSCNNSTHDDSEDSCHQPWHIHSRCMTFKDKHLNKILLQVPLPIPERFLIIWNLQIKIKPIKHKVDFENVTY